MMYGMALCAGVGGIELGLRLAEPEYRTVCYVEREAYAASILRTRMEDKTLDEAPIWDDVESFDGKPWHGKVDVITSGFPCQPWSHAGKRKGTEDERWIWNDIQRIICEVRPRFVFLENVPGLISGGGLQIILGELTEAGYDAEWLPLSAAQVGANHLRERIWILGWNTQDNRNNAIRAIQEGENTESRRVSKILAHPINNGLYRQERNEAEQEGNEQKDGLSIRDGSNLAYSDTRWELQQEGCKPDLRRWSSNGSEDISNSKGGRSGGLQDKGREERSQNSDELFRECCGISGDASNSKEQGLEGNEPTGCSCPHGCSSKLGWWSVEPSVGRVADGMALRVDRLRACGNGVVPLVAATAWRILRERAGMNPSQYNLQGESNG